MIAAFITLIKTLFTEPVKFFIQLWETLDSWLSSRAWMKLGVALLPLLLMSILIVPVLRGRLLTKQELTARYAKLFADEVEKVEKQGSPSNVKDSSKQSKGMELAEIASRRLLKLQPGNEQARFYVAQGMARRGQVNNARVIFSELAPDKTVGYIPAHTWLVQDLLNRAEQAKQAPPMNLLKHHLQAATTSQDATAQLFRLHAAILESEQKKDEAIEQMNKAAQKDSRYWLELASLCRRSGKEEQVEIAAKNALQYSLDLLQKVDASTPFEQTEQIRSQVSAGYCFSGDFDKAIEVLKQGLQKDKDCSVLRQSLSNVYLLRYQRDLQRANDPSKVSLNDLEEAMGWNPANVVVADLISQLMVFQTEKRQQIGEMLRKQVASGGASAITHILLANEAIIDSKIDDALPHLEIAYKHNSKAINILNNLSLALALSSKPDVSRAEGLIDEAIKIAGESPEILDTKGQILTAAGKEIDAIRCYERAIELIPNRIRTRERLAALYERVGMKELVPPQLAAIERIKEEMRLAIERREAQSKGEEMARAALRRKPLAPRCQPPEFNSGGPPVPPGVE